MEAALTWRLGSAKTWDAFDGPGSLKIGSSDCAAAMKLASVGNGTELYGRGWVDGIACFLGKFATDSLAAF